MRKVIFGLIVLATIVGSAVVVSASASMGFSESDEAIYTTVTNQDNSSISNEANITNVELTIEGETRSQNVSLSESESADFYLRGGADNSSAGVFYLNFSDNKLDEVQDSVDVVITYSNGSTESSTYSYNFNSQPTATVNGGDKTVVVGDTFTLNATNSTANDGPIDNVSSYKWDFDNDGTWDSNGSVVAHEYLVSDYHNVTLQVTDQSGATHNSSVTVTAEATDGSGGSGSSSGVSIESILVNNIVFILVLALAGLLGFGARDS